MVEAIGTEEHPGRVRGLGRGIGFKAYFGRCQSSTEKMSKKEVEEIVAVKLGEQRDKLWERFLEEEREKLLQEVRESVQKEQEERERMNEKKRTEKCTCDVLEV